MNPEIAQYETLAKDLMQQCLSVDDPAALHQWIIDQLARMGGAPDGAILTWPASFDLFDALLAKYEQTAKIPEAQRKTLDWPWASWAQMIDPLEPGMLALVTAPDGAGKTLYAEMIAEHWAKKRNRVAYCHFELSRNLMTLRRTARHTSLTVRQLKGGTLTPEQRGKVADARRQLLEWEGYISYIHTPGWTMESTTAALRQLANDGQCDVAVIDYLEKASVSERQTKTFGTNPYQREADNVEQLKTFSETTGVPVLMVAQMNKAGKGQSFENVDRNSITGSGDKSNRANLVVILSRERVATGYSATVMGLIDKNTMGACGTFEQFMQPEFFRVGDIYEGGKK